MSIQRDAFDPPTVLTHRISYEIRSAKRIDFKISKLSFELFGSAFIRENDRLACLAEIRKTINIIYHDSTFSKKDYQLITAELQSIVALLKKKGNYAEFSCNLLVEGKLKDESQKLTLKLTAEGDLEGDNFYQLLGIPVPKLLEAVDKKSLQ